jgi:hypothetical protein
MPISRDRIQFNSSRGGDPQARTIHAMGFGPKALVSIAIALGG